MKMKITKAGLSVALLAAGCGVAAPCTSAIIGPKASASGRPLLWKHRDTSTIDNKVEYVAPTDSTLGYVALFNADDPSLEQAWMGMNDAGFAVMNTASYNIKDDKVPDSKMDREGFLMTVALRECRTVDDFARLLDNYPRPMGVEANFGVIDASGDGAFFETNNDSYVRYDLSDSPDGALVRTNYSHSGRKNEGYGFDREAAAVCILQPYVANRSVTPELLTEDISRSFYHGLKKKDFSDRKTVVDNGFIPRYKSTATVVIEGIVPHPDGSMPDPEEVASQYVMWTGMGYPPLAEIEPVFCRPGGVPDDLRGSLPNGHSPQGDRVKALRDKVFSSPKGKKDKQINMQLLYNHDGTGFVQQLRPRNHEVYERVKNERDAAGK